MFDEDITLKELVAMLEEWKPLPKDKMARQIARKEKRAKDGDKKADTQSHRMKVAKNYLGKMTDVSKADQKFVGRDRHKWNAQKDKIEDETDKKGRKWVKAEDKAEAAKKKDKKKLQKKADKKYDKLEKGEKKREGMRMMRDIKNNAYKDDLESQAAVNRKEKEDKAKAKGMMNRAKAESALKAKPKKERIKGPKVKNPIKKEALDFTQFCDSLTAPLYEKEGELPKCPPGYKFDKNMMMCVPKTEKDSVGPSKYGDKDLRPGNGPGYHAIGNSGYSGAGYAFEEPPTSNDRAVQ